MTQEVYLEHLRQCKEAVKIPILASLNGATPGGWVRFAKDMEQAGADAIELNTYALATDKSQTSAELEGQLLNWCPRLPPRSRFRWSVKLSQSFTSLPHLVGGNWRKRARAAWCSSTASISRTSTSRRWRCGPRCTSPRPRSCCRGCTGRRFSTAT
jgi:hypothetical protein